MSSRISTLALAAALAACGCDEGNGDGETDGVALADTVVEAPGDTGDGFGDASHAIDGVHGAGAQEGNADDVFSLGYETGENDYIILSWSGRRVANGAGADFAVFENAFFYGGGAEAFMDLAVVSVSRDGVTWAVFPHDYLADDETVYSALPEDWSGFAGKTPSLLNDATNPVDPFDGAAAGGDEFDLDALGDDAESTAIKAEGFIYLKLASASAETNPDTSAAFVRDAISDGPDIDGVYARYAVEE